MSCKPCIRATFKQQCVSASLSQLAGAPQQPFQPHGKKVLCFKAKISNTSPESPCNKIKPSYFKSHFKFIPKHHIMLYKSPIRSKPPAQGVIQREPATSYWMIAYRTLTKIFRLLQVKRNKPADCNAFFRATPFCQVLFLAKAYRFFNYLTNIVIRTLLYLCCRSVDLFKRSTSVFLTLPGACPTHHAKWQGLCKSISCYAAASTMR